MERKVLEMYRDAFNYHKRDGDPGKARLLYKEIIQKYPVSDVADYASIQLRYLDSLPVTIPKERARTAMPTYLPLLISLVSLIAAVAIIAFGMVHIKQKEARLALMSEVSMVEEYIRAGQTNEALLQLSSLKLKHSDELMLFVLAAEIHSQRKDFNAARMELQGYQRMYPTESAVLQHLRNIDALESVWLEERIEKESALSEKGVESRKSVKPVTIKRRENSESGEVKYRPVRKEEVSFF